MVFHNRLIIKTDKRINFYDITDNAVKIQTGSEIKSGIMTIYSQHTTCSVFIQEQSDDVDYWGTQFILQDMVNGLEKIFPKCNTIGQYLHPGPLHIKIAEDERNEKAFWSLNTDAHLRSVLLGRSVCIPIEDQKLQLGEFGRIYFVDFDQVRERERIVRISIMGE